MEVVSFARSDYAKSDPGTAFHHFVCEWLALSTRTPLNSYLAPGKDGAIDLFDQHHQGVFECKFVGEDGLDAIRPRWREVERHLLDNLLPNGPRNGQSQYRPWYNATQPIRHYSFCASSRFKNHEQGQTLKAEIEAVFAMLAQRPGLAHLAQVQVRVLSWDSFDAELARHPQLKLRWFGLEAAGVGLQEFSRVHERVRHGFQTYLYGATTIRYVQVRSDLAPNVVLDRLAGSDGPPAMVLHGRGGAGKSRLMVEAGLAARQANWVVLVAQARSATPEALATAVRTAGRAPVLVLMDYIERCASWDAWMYQLDALVQGGAKVRLLGTCRGSFIDRLDPYQVALEPLPDTLDTTVSDMLAQRDGLAALAPICRGVPVFAAFLCFLQDKGDTTALEALRHQQDFGRWLLTHIAQWPMVRSGTPPAPIGAPALASLSELLVNLPCSAAALQALESARPELTTVRQQLLNDGWLDFDLGAAGDDSEVYTAVHDVLADGALLQWLQYQRPHAAEAELLCWLQTAVHTGNLSSMLRALQRVAKEPAMLALHWHAVFSRLDLGSEGARWRDLVLATGLMPPRSAIDWLQRHGEVAVQAIASPVVMGVLASAVEAWRTSNGAATDKEAANEALLIDWTDAAVAALDGKGMPLTATARNDVLVQALRGWPARYEGAARRWLDAHAEQGQAQYLLNAWLQAADRLPYTVDTACWCRRWLALHRRFPVASFVFKSWLDAQGDKAVVQAAIEQWLAVPSNALALQAQFVFTSWLDAQGDKVLVQPAIVQWLTAPGNAVAVDASFVFKSWLDAQGDKAVVQPLIVQWLAVPSNAVAPGASFVFKSWLDAQGDKSVVQSAIGAWLAVQRNAVAPGASFVFKSWLDAQGDKAVVQSAIGQWLAAPGNAASRDAGFVFRSWGNREKHLPPWMESAAETWLMAWHHDVSDHVVFPLKYIARMPGLSTKAAEAVVAWCFSFPDAGDALSRVQRLVPRFERMAGRTELLTGVGQLIQRALPSDGRGRPPSAILAAARCVASAARLTLRSAVERAAFRHIACATCTMLRCLAQSARGDLCSLLAGLPPNALSLTVSTDWERLLLQAIAEGERSDALLLHGMALWADACAPLVERPADRAMYDRLRQAKNALAWPPAITRPLN